VNPRGTAPEPSRLAEAPGDVGTPVVPAKAGTQVGGLRACLDPGLRRDDKTTRGRRGLGSDAPQRNPAFSDLSEAPTRDSPPRATCCACSQGRVWPGRSPGTPAQNSTPAPRSGRETRRPAGARRPAAHRTPHLQRTAGALQVGAVQVGTAPSETRPYAFAGPNWLSDAKGDTPPTSPGVATPIRRRYRADSLPAGARS